MSFAADVKNELARLKPDRLCCRKAELTALLLLNGHVHTDEGQTLLRAEVENPATARKLFVSLKEIYGVQAKVTIKIRRRFRKTRIYEVTSHLDEAGITMLEELGLSSGPGGRFKPHINSSLLRKTCCKRSFLRGVFLSRGFVSRPEGNYHLEISLNDTALAQQVQKLMSRLGLEARLTERKTNLVLYIKGAESIVDFLRTVGASKALLDFENARILKSMRNNVNRQVNCETANLIKTVDASVRQVETIRQITTDRGWEAIPSGLRSLAQLRLEYPDASLKELGEMMSPPLTKSGVAYRIRKLEEMADQLGMGN